jgi:hypothetical protein
MSAAAMHDDRGGQGNHMGALWLWVSPCMETSLKCCSLFLRRELQISAQQVPSVCTMSLSGVEVASHLSCTVTDLERGKKAEFLELDF